MLFNHNRKRAALVWKIISVIVVVGMLIFYMAPLIH
jgi:hypothetical protein